MRKGIVITGWGMPETENWSSWLLLALTFNVMKKGCWIVPLHMSGFCNDCARLLLLGLICLTHVSVQGATTVVAHVDKNLFKKTFSLVFPLCVCTCVTPRPVRLPHFFGLFCRNENIPRPDPTSPLPPYLSSLISYVKTNMPPPHAAHLLLWKWNRWWSQTQVMFFGRLYKTHCWRRKSTDLQHRGSEKRREARTLRQV